MVFLVESLETALKILINSLPYIFQLLLFFLIPFSFFSVLGVKMFGSRLFYCVNIPTDINHLIDNLTDCFDFGGDWINSDVNFDSFLSAFVSLFQLITTEGWSYIMIKAIDSRDKGQAPKFNNNPWSSLFFIFLFIVGNILLLSMIVSIMVTKFLDEKDRQDPLFNLSPEHREWAGVKLSIYNTSPMKKTSPPKSKLRLFIYHVVKNKYFKVSSLLFTIIHSITLASYYQRQDKEFINALNVLNLVLLSLFLIEEIFRSMIFGIRFYFSKPWNIFDSFVITISLSFFIASHLDTSKNLKTIAYPIQILRLVRLIRKVKLLRKTFYRISVILPQTSSITILYGLVMLVYAFIGIEFFAFVKPQSTIGGKAANFRSLFGALQILLRTTTGESWYNMMADLTRKPTPNFNCEEITNYHSYSTIGYIGCGNNFAYFYFFTFHLIVSLIILNLFIAIMLTASEDTARVEASAVNRYQLDHIQRLWRIYDPLATGYITYKDFWKYSSEIAIIFGINKNDLMNPKNKKSFLKALAIPVYENKISRIFTYKFHDVLLSLAKISVLLKFDVDNLEPPPDDPASKYIEKRISKGKKTLKDTYLKTEFDSCDMASLMILRRPIKRWIKIKNWNAEQKLDGSNIKKRKFSRAILDIFDVSRMLKELKKKKDEEEKTKSVGASINLCPNPRKNDKLSSLVSIQSKRSNKSH